jgi:hypothetical protein
MSAARLILKQPTGWFAAGREVAQALALLSDGAFKLYIHLCLEADRHTSRAGIELPELTRFLRKDPKIPVSYWDHVRRKMEALEKRWLQTANGVLSEPSSPEIL